MTVSFPTSPLTSAGIQVASCFRPSLLPMRFSFFFRFCGDHFPLCIFSLSNFFSSSLCFLLGRSLSRIAISQIFYR